MKTGLLPAEVMWRLNLGWMPGAQLSHSPLLSRTQGEQYDEKSSPCVVGCCSKAAQPFAHVEAAGGARDAPLSGDKLVSAAHSGLCFTQLSIKHVLNRSRWIILLTWTWADEQQAVKKKQQMLLFMHETPWLCRDTVICMNNTTYANVCLNTWGKVRKMQGTDTAHW